MVTVGAARTAVLACLVAAAPARAVDLTVEFAAGGRCTVTTTGDRSRSVRVVDVPQPVVPASEYRCDVSPGPQGRPIQLVVVLPPGDTPAGADFPRLAWTEQDGRWLGSATLPAPPSFVRVAKKGSAAARRARLLDVAALAATAIAIGWTIARLR